MLAWIIKRCLGHPQLVLVFALVAALIGVSSLNQLAVDAIPDLSDVQVIVKTDYPGQAPQIVEQQVTFPMANGLMAVPKAKTVRGFSFFGDSYVYVIFEDGTDPYWARSRVLEYLSQITADLPADATPELGPDASGVGWVYQYALTDPSGQHNIPQLRSLQDWFVKLELQSVEGVSEVATVGGMEQTYQVVLSPAKMLQYGLTISQVRNTMQQGNSETGGGVLEMAEAEYMVRATGYVQSLKYLENLPLGIRSEQGIPLLLKHVATIRLGPQMRRGVAELNGDGEVVGGIVVMRQGENAQRTIAAVKAKLEQISPGLPEGVEIVPVYDRSTLIEGAVDNLKHKLAEEIVVVILVCLAFLLHLRSTLVAVICLPLAVLIGFILMQVLSINANIMSLGGIAIAIGALVDAAVVMLENQHKHLEHYQQQHGYPPQGVSHWKVVAEACVEVGPALCLSLLIITLSFTPVFALQGQEGRLFAPLALTKTLVMAAAALLSVTLVPVLLGYLVRGRIPSEQQNPITRILIALYRPVLNSALKAPLLVLVLALGIAASAYYPLTHTSSEFMPELEEGDLLYMPTTLPGISIAKAAEVLQQTDRLIKTVPEVKSVFGKVGRAETATDPAPLTMLETTIQLKDKSQWRAGVDLAHIITELEQKVTLPGLTNAWVQPIKTRIDMLSTGIKTPLGLKISGPDLATLQQLGQEVEGLLSQLPQTRSVYAERSHAGRYIDIQPKREMAATYGLSINDIQQVVKYAIGGANVGESVQGQERYPINLRYPREYRDSIEALKQLQFVSPSGQWVMLQQVADIQITQGPAVIKSENARPNALVFIDVNPGTGLDDYMQLAKKQLAQLKLPPKYSISFTGQYEYLERMKARLLWVVPATLLITLLLLYLTFQSLNQALLVMATLPVALAGSCWFIYLLGYQFSVAVAVGMIALAGVAAEFGVVMLIYLNQALKTHKDIHTGIMAGAVQRVRPKAMTVITIVAGLLPIMLGSGVGNEVMQRIAAPMLGGMILSPLVSMFILPCALMAFKGLRQRQLRPSKYGPPLTEESQSG